VGTPTEVLRAFTFAPAEMVIVKNKNDEREKLWNKVSDYTKQDYPICCTTSEDITKGGLTPGHSYTLVIVDRCSWPVRFWKILKVFIIK
jgi:hypothetical protein